jgi:succinate-semialdehyde dehydrogenase/glutarate-semialdehyde dehydrogenase
MSYQSVNPYNGKVLRAFEELSNKQLETSIETAATCFENWRRTTFAERALVAGKAASIMRARIDQFASLVTLEMGKLIEQSRGEVVLSADIIDYFRGFSLYTGCRARHAGRKPHRYRHDVR